MENYLITDYKMVEDKKWLKSENDICDYFKDCQYDYLDCGQGYYTDKAQVYCKIRDKYYLVYISGDVASSRSEYGDNLYWIDSVSVDYEEIDKPKQKERKTYNFSIELTESEYKSLRDNLNENKFIYQVN